MASQVLSWRLNPGGWSYAVTMKVLQNAFGSASWEALDQVAEMEADRQGEDLRKQRYRNTAVDPPTHDGARSIKAGERMEHSENIHQNE